MALSKADRAFIRRLVREQSRAVIAAFRQIVYDVMTEDTRTRLFAEMTRDHEQHLS